MTMTTNDKKMLEREALRSVIQQWNANRLDLFELSEPDENLQFHGVMRFYFQDAGQKVATKCIRVASDATVADVIETLVEKFRPDMRMLTLPNYALYEVHSNHEERKLNPDEKPLLVQLNWHIDDREGRFLLKNIDQKTNTLDSNDTIFKRKLSKREKKEQKKKDKLAKLNSNSNDSENHVAERLYTELPETSFTRSISNPEAVMRRRRQQKLEKKLQQFRSRDGGPDTGGTLKIYGESLCRDVPYKTLLLSIRDCAQAVVREMLAKYGMEKADPLHYCLVQVNADATEYILDDDECPLSILMNHPTSRGSIMFHVRRRPADSQPRRRKKKPLGVSNGSTNVSNDREGPTLVEITHSGDGGRRIKLGSEPIEVGSANTNTLQLFGPSIQPRHCLISLLEGVCTVTPLHADALTFVNGHHIQQPTILHNGSVVMFGRVASYRFIDSPSDGRYNLALSQSQLDSACLYESRSPISTTWPEDDRPLSPVHSVAQAQTQNIKQKYVDFNEISSSNSRNLNTTSKQSFNIHTNSSSNHNNSHHHHPNAGMQQDVDQSSQHNEDGKSVQGQEDKRRGPDSNHLDVPYDIDGNTENETKSISSIKSTGSNQDIRSNKMQQSSEQGQEPILPAVLEFPETHQDTFLRNIISELDVNTPNFKLAPVYTLYLCARYRASTHYRPDLQPTERAHKLTVFLHHVANLIHNVVQDQYTDPKVLSFWMANSSEFLYFLKSDRHISAFSVQAQEVLAESVQTAFRNLVTCFHAELSQTLSQFMSENIEHEAAAGLVLQVLGSAMALFRRCRVNAALTIQLFSQLFHYINVLCFNKIVTTTYMCTSEWGKVLSERLQLLELWAERQGLELAADCHLAKINQCAQFLQAPKSTVADVQQLACSCFKLNSLQMAALLSQETIPRNLVDTAVRMAESVADELARADGREIRLEESPELPLALILPDDGFSCDVVRGIPAGLVDFLTPLQGSGMCRLAAQPTSIGLWTVYMHHYNGRSPSAMSSKAAQPEVQVIKLHKHSNGMGLSIVAAKGAGQERLGIYIKSVVPGGAADLDGRLQAGDQLLRVDGQSLIGITQERAADYLVRTGPVVTLEVAKQGAIYHGLATLLQQPSPVIQRGTRRMSERDLSRQSNADSNKPPIPMPSQNLLNAKSTPALHHVGNIAMSGNKSRSIHNLAGNNTMSSNTNSIDQGFYQNLSIYRAQNQSQPNLGDRNQMSMQSNININAATASNANLMQNNNRPASAYYNNTNSNTLPSQSTMSYLMQPNNNVNSSQNPNMPQSGGNPVPGNQMLARQKNNNFSGSQNMRMNQMMAPSMPNIAHSSGYAANISASQSMQNVNMISNYHPGPSNQHMYTTTPNELQQQQQHQQTQQQHQQQQQQRLLRGQAKLAEMGEELKRRHQRQPADTLSNDLSQIIAPSGSGMSPQLLSPTGNQPKQQMMLPGQQNYPNQPNTNGPMSSIKQLPPTAPKPNRFMQDNSEAHQQMPLQQQHHQPPLPPTQTHPLFKNSNQQQQNPNLNYVASAADPPKVAYYPISSSNIASSKNYVGTTNPWEREEREKEQEIRREHIRQWRDQQIFELSSLQHRTPQQEEQLKTLVLERDFERRAQETEEQEDDSDIAFPKDSVHELIRLQPANQLPSPMTSMKQVDVKDGPSENYIPPQQSSTLPTIQPKSILKHNSNRMDNPASSNPQASPSKHAKSATFADDKNLPDLPPPSTSIMNQMMKDIYNMNLNNSNNVTNSNISKELELASMPPAMQSIDENFSNARANMMYDAQNNNSVPPPPPERNSSYVIMSQQQQKNRTSTLPNLNKQSAIIPSAAQSTDSQNNNYQMSNTKKIPTINNNLTNNTNNNHSNNSNLINNNVGPHALPPQIQIPTSQNQYSMQQPLTPPSQFNRDNKRVSFHDEENNLVMSPIQQQMVMSGMTDQQQLEIIREDPNRFINETQALLDSPMTPDTSESWNSPIQMTPGVIGAQEVYRDPRTRRLAEKQQAQQQKTDGQVPEKLSFKEKMKMFALESGEDQTPKDKVKISRAQRDIDAVH